MFKNYSFYIDTGNRNFNIVWNDITQFGSFGFLLIVGASFYFVNINPSNVATTSGVKTGLYVETLASSPDQTVKFDVIKENSINIMSYIKIIY